jgi:hypothetical protein
MKKLLVGAALAGAAVGGGVLASGASAGPANSPTSLTFEDVECLGLLGQPDAVVTDFTVVGNGNGVAHSGAGIFQPLALEVTINGEPDPEGDDFVKPGVGKSEWRCTGETTFDTPGGPVTISFAALGLFHP